MATDIERLMVRLEANATSFERALEKARKTADGETAAIEKRFDRANSNIASHMRSLGTSVGNVAGMIAGPLAAALSVNAIREYSDAWTDMGNKIRASGEDISGVMGRQKQLADIAMRSRVPLDGVTDGYTMLRRATEDLEPSQAQLLRVTETISKALASEGANTSTINSVMTQLGQGLGSGALQGDEFRSLREGSITLTRALADEMGVSMGKLKQLAADGEISADRVIKAFLKVSPAVDAAFANSIPTVEQALANLRTAVTQWVGTSPEIQKWTQSAAQGLMWVANNIDPVIRGAAVLGIALLAAMGGPVTAGIAAAGAGLALFGDQIHPISGELATLADYAAVAFDMVKSNVSNAAASVAPLWVEAVSKITDILSGVGAAAGEGFAMVASAAKLNVNAIVATFLAAKDIINASWNTLAAAIGDGVVTAMNAAIAAIEAALKKIVSAVNSVIGSVNAGTSAVGLGALIPEMRAADLGRIENSYAGAGQRAAQAYGKAFERFSVDYVGDAAKSVSESLTRIQSDANKRAEDRLEREREARRASRAGSGRDGDLNKALKAPPKDAEEGGGGSGKGGRGSKGQDEFARAIAQTEKKIADLRMETELVGQAADAVARQRKEHELLTAAKQAGMPIDDALRAKIGQLSEAYAQAETVLKRKQEALKAFNDAANFAGQSLSSFFSDIVSGGKNAGDALMNLTKKLADAALQAALLGSGPLGNLFGTGGKDGAPGGLLGALFGGLRGVLGFAEGGYTGAGGKYTPAGIVHAGEFVFSRAAVKAIGVQNLAAMHGAARGFANGGFVGSSTDAMPVVRRAEPMRVEMHNHGVDLRVQRTQENRIRIIARQEAGGIVGHYDGALMERVGDKSARSW